MSARVLLFVPAGALARGARGAFDRLAARLANELPACRPTELVKWDAERRDLRYLDRVDLEMVYGTRTLPAPVRVHPFAHRVGTPFRDTLEGEHWLVVPGAPRESVRVDGVRTAAIVDHLSAAAPLMAGCDLALAVSQHAANAVATAKHAVLPLPAERGPAGKHPSQDGDAIVLLGGFAPPERQLELLKAFRRLQDGALQGLELIVCAPLPPAYLAELNRLLAAGARIRHCGEGEFVAAARFAVAAAEDGTLGEALRAALANGVPCLTPLDAASAELAAAGGCLAVDFSSAVAIESGLARLAGDGDLRERLAREAAARPRSSWGEYAAQLVALLEKDAH